MQNKTIWLIAVLVCVGYIVSFNYGGCGGGAGGGKTDSGSSGTPTPTPTLTAPAQVTSPNPADYANNVPITQQLGWASATGATSYDVYFGVTYTGWSPVTNISGTTYNPGTLTYSTTYYWRIDSKNTTGTTTGIVWWCFLTQSLPVTAPAQVTTPNPADYATNVSITPQLSWTSASGATSYDVYFGVAGTGPLTFKGNQPGTSYNSGTLAYNTMYCWRIDSKNTGGTTTGILWAFTTVAPSTWTIFVYGHADHNLGPNLISDILEMNNATIGSHMNVILRADFNTTTYPTFTGTQWFRITGGGGDGIDLGGTAEVNSDDPNILASEIEAVFTTYPADKYAIVFWDHGGSWDGGFGGEQNDTLIPVGTEMTAAQMATAVSTALTNTGISGTRSLEFIAYDTCLMAGNEVAYEFRNIAKTYIACAELDFGAGWDYTSTLTYINNNPNLPATSIATQEVNDWNSAHLGDTVSDDLIRSHIAIDLSKMDAYATAWFNLGDTMYFSGTLDWTDVARKQYKTLPGYRVEFGEENDYPNIRDAGQFLNNLSTITSDLTVASNAVAVSNSLNTLILNVSNGSLRAGENQKGLHFEMPLAKNWPARKTAYTALNWDIATEWSYLLDKLQSQSNSVAPVFNTTAYNTITPNATNLPTILFSSADSDIVEAQLLIAQTIAGNNYWYGLIGDGCVTPSTQWQFTWNGNLFGLNDGNVSSYGYFKKISSGGDLIPTLYAFQGILAKGAETYTAYAVLKQGDATVSLLLVESASGSISVASMEDHKGWYFTPQLYNDTMDTWVNQTTLTIPNTASPYLTFSKWPAAAGNYYLATTITDVWGNIGAEADNVTVVTPFGN